MHVYNIYIYTKYRHKCILYIYIHKSDNMYIHTPQTIVSSPRNFSPQPPSSCRTCCRSSDCCPERQLDVKNSVGEGQLVRDIWNMYGTCGIELDPIRSFMDMTGMIFHDVRPGKLLHFANFGKITMLSMGEIPVTQWPFQMYSYVFYYQRVCHGYENGLK